MTLNDGFDRTVAGWLDEQAGRGAPSYLDEVLARTVRTRQRPAWSSLERWLPMQTTLRFVPVPRAAWLLVVLALLVTLGAAAVWIGSQQREGLPPFGPAANGAIIYGASDGDIYTLDLATGASTPLVDDSTADRSPFFSRDGSMFVFARSGACCGLMEITLANVDGTVIRSLTSPNFPTWADWSPDGTRLAVIGASASTFSIVTVADGEAVEIELGLTADRVFWRPGGRELVFHSVPGKGVETFGLYVVRADGSGLRPILPPEAKGAQYAEPALSPDGTQVVYTVWDGDTLDGGHLYVVDVDSEESQLLSFENRPNSESDYFARWSPDGRQIVFNRGTAQVAYHVSVASAGGGAVVNIGPELDWAAGAIAAFSPDGSKVIAQYSNGQTWLFDVDGGPGQRLDIAATDLLTWQRVAP